MDLYGVEHEIIKASIVMTIGLYIFGTFASFTFGTGLVALTLYIFIIWIWLD